MNSLAAVRSVYRHTHPLTDKVSNKGFRVALKRIKYAKVLSSWNSLFTIMKSLKLRILLFTILLVKVHAQDIGLENRSPETKVRTVFLKETEEREGLKYIPGEKIPFTGKIFSPYNKGLHNKLF